MSSRISSVFSGGTSEHEAGLDNAAWLVDLRPGGAEHEARRGLGSINEREVSSKEKAILDISRGDGECERAATRTVQQVDGVGVRDGSTRLNVFRSDRQRESVFEITCDQESTTIRVCALKNSYARIRLHNGVLIVWVDHPTPMAVSVEEVVDLRVV